MAERENKLDDLNQKQPNVLDNLNQMKDLQYRYFGGYLSDTPERKLAFTVLLHDRDLIMKLAYRNKLLKTELYMVYSKYASYFFNKTKKKFHLYYRYCTTFKDFLSNDEKGLLIQYLINNKYWHYINVSLKDFKFDKEQKNILLKHVIMHKLIGCIIWISIIPCMALYKRFSTNLFIIGLSYMTL